MIYVKYNIEIGNFFVNITNELSTTAIFNVLTVLFKL